MTRKRLDDRRRSFTVNVQWTPPGGQDHKLIVTYGVNDEWTIREVFCAGFRADTQICALANDACILLSRLLQYGETISMIAPKLGEDRGEGDEQGPPSSIIGAIARQGAALQLELYEQRRIANESGEPPPPA